MAFTISDLQIHVTCRTYAKYAIYAVSGRGSSTRPHKFDSEFTSIARRKNK